jgi:hypothetical protein
LKNGNASQECTSFGVPMTVLCGSRLAVWNIGWGG